MKDVKNVRVEVRMTADEKEELRKCAAAANTNISEIIRRLCKEYVEKCAGKNE